MKKDLRKKSSRDVGVIRLNMGDYGVKNRRREIEGSGEEKGEIMPDHREEIF